MKLVRARDVMGLPVVSIASGEDVAEVRDVAYDGEAHRLVGFTLNQRAVVLETDGSLSVVAADRCRTASAMSATIAASHLAVGGAAADEHRSRGTRE